MKISKTLLIPIFLMIGGCLGLKNQLKEQHRQKLEANSYFTHVVDVLRKYGHGFQPSGYHNFVMNQGSGAPWPHGSNANCENFYLAYKELINNLHMHPNVETEETKQRYEEYIAKLGDKNGDGSIYSKPKDTKTWLDLLDTRATASVMYSYTDMNNDGYITEAEASFCLRPFFNHFAVLKSDELSIKLAETRKLLVSSPKSLELDVSISKKLESFIEELDKIAPYQEEIPSASTEKEL